MRILFITNNFAQFRGTQRMMLETAKTFAEEHETAAWCYDMDGEAKSFFIKAGIQTYCGIDKLENMLLFHPDIVNIHRGGSERKLDSDIIDAFRRTGAKIIETSVFGWVDYHSNGRIDLSLQISRWDLKRWLMRKGPFTRTLGVYLPCLVDTKSFVRPLEVATANYRAALGIPKDAFVIGRAGKSAWNLVAPAVLKTLDENPTVHFLSISDYCGKDIPQTIANHPKVHLIPRCFTNEELSQFYSACTVFLSASGIGESFGMVVAEAMACETPVIGWATPQIDNAQAELIRHGEGGWLIKTVSELPKLVHSLIGHPLNEIGAHARKSIVRRYSRPVVASMLKRAFAAVETTNSKKELKARLLAEGFDIDIPKDEFNGYIENAIGSYPANVKLWQAINTSYILQKLYAFYNFIHRRNTP